MSVRTYLPRVPFNRIEIKKKKEMGKCKQQQQQTMGEKQAISDS